MSGVGERGPGYARALADQEAITEPVFCYFPYQEGSSKDLDRDNSLTGTIRERLG